MRHDVVRHDAVHFGIGISATTLLFLGVSVLAASAPFLLLWLLLAALVGLMVVAAGLAAVSIGEEWHGP